ncbi:MAG: ATP-binding cassette domain-containing protein [Eubacterium sp.]|nr:ATP-binding cassette domain-containing protein [Eubacterium sp.]
MEEAEKAEEAEEAKKTEKAEKAEKAESAITAETCTGQTTGRIKILHIDKSYGTLHVLQNLSTTIEKGQRCLLMAPSGSGKTTFLRILTGLEDADRGEITGVPQRIGMVFQEDRLCEEYDAICNIMLGMGGRIVCEYAGYCLCGNDENSKSDGNDGKQVRSKKIPNSQLKSYIAHEAAKILPEDCLTKPVKELSGGMRRRVALLRAVMSQSDMLVLDEPFTGLDEKNRERCAEYLLGNLRGRTLLVTTHREEDIELLHGIKVALVFSESLCYNA